LGAKPTWKILVSGPGLLMFITAAAIWRSRTVGFRSAVLGSAVLLATASGIIGVVAQGKGWTYHWLPVTLGGVMLVVLSIVPSSVLCLQQQAKGFRILAMAVLGMYVVFLTLFSGSRIRGRLTGGYLAF